MSPLFRLRSLKAGASQPTLSVEDRAVLEQLRQAGSDLSRPHPIDHYLYFPKEDAARSAANVLRGEGYRVDVRVGADEVNWLALASHSIVPTPQTIAETTARMEKLAASLGGEYDGWQAAVVK